MRQSRVKKRWAQGKPVLGTVAHFSDPASAELIGLMGFDCLWIDLEHQPLGMADAANMIRAARVGMEIRSEPVAVYYPPAAQRFSHYRPWRDTLRIIAVVVRLILRR